MNEILLAAGGNSRRRLRVQVALEAALEYLATCGFLAVYWRLGKVDGAFVAGFLAFSIAVNGLLLSAIASGWTEKLRDPSITAVQMMISCCRDLSGCVLAPDLWFIFAFNLFVALPFGSLQFTNRAFTSFWALTSTGLGAIFLKFPASLQIGFDTRGEKFILWAFLSMAFGRLAVFNSRISTLRRGLRARGLQVAQAGRQMERERIARDLHDTLLQAMYGLIWRLEAIAKSIPSDDPVRASIACAIKQTEQALVECRNQVQGLRLPVEAARSLTQALRHAGEGLAQDTGLAFHVNAPAEAPVLTEDVHVGFERIMLEALGNAFRHSGGHHVWLEVEYGSESVRAAVRDDGRGIPTATVCRGRRGHFGIAVMRERAASIHAAFAIEALPGGGTQVCVQIPASLAYEVTASKPALWIQRLARMLCLRTASGGSSA